MSQIDREMEQIGRRGGALAPFSSVPTSAAPHHGHALHAALGAAASAISSWLERARMRRHLLMLDDRLLRDIGVTRQQVWTEAEKPFWRA
jgi:uncharacterized protein YjiS (DUF1127 family)